MGKELNWTDGDKLILSMLCEIYEHLGVKGSIDHKLVQQAIWGGHGWALRDGYATIFVEERDPETVREVKDILDMWWHIEKRHERLTAEEKARVETEAEPFGDCRFRGFDGNHEGAHFSIAHMLIDDLQLFTGFKGRDLNSGMPMLVGDRRMLHVFRRLRSSDALADLSVSNLIEILNARKHPEQR